MSKRLRPALTTKFFEIIIYGQPSSAAVIIDVRLQYGAKVSPLCGATYLHSIGYVAAAVAILLLASGISMALLQPWKFETNFSASPLSAKASIAVLPCSNLSGDLTNLAAV